MVASETRLQRAKRLSISAKDSTMGVIAGLGYRVWVSPTVENAFAFTEKLQKKGGGTILNILGEHHHDLKLVERDFGRYMKLADAIAERKKKGTFNAAVSIKPSQFGLHVTSMDRKQAEKYTLKKMWEYVDHATKQGIHVEMDVETSKDHKFTYDAYKEFARRLAASKRSGMMGVAVQANYENACDRLKDLMDLDEKTYGKLKFRLVQGIYTKAKGDPSAISEPEKMIEAYQKLVDTALAHKKDHHVIALGTHREDIAEKLVEGANEIQMLAGIRVPMRVGLQKHGVKAWVYTPIGTRQEAGPYAARRLSKATGLLWKTATDFFRPSIWRGTWYAEAKGKQKR